MILFPMPIMLGMFFMVPNEDFIENVVFVFFFSVLIVGSLLVYVIGSMKDQLVNMKYLSKDTEIIEYFLELFEGIEPDLTDLRKQVIHGDANNYNVVVDESNAIGVIDFGDMIHSQLIFDLAIALAYVILDKKDILLSGYIEKEKLVSDRNAMIWMRKGEGQLVLFGFNPQFRAATAGTYKLLFNALLLGDADSMPSP